MEHERPSTSGIERLYKKRKAKAFKESWLDNETLKGWLKIHPDGARAYCTACEKALVCGKSELIRHASRAIHIHNISRPRSDKTNSNPLALSPVMENINYIEKVKQAENKLAIFYAEYNIALDSLSYMVHLLQDICIEPRVVHDLALSRKKCTQIITNVIGKREDENTIGNLKQQRFSVLIEESTAVVTNDKILSILVKYVDRDSKESTTKLLELIKLNEKNCSASEIYLAFKNCLENKGIPLKNIIGIACNNTPVMTANYDSFISRLKEEIPVLVLFKCMCHSSVLVARKACSRLPSSCEYVLHAIAKYFSNSANKSAILCEYKQFFGIELREVLKLSGITWFVLQKFVPKLLNNWDALKHCFYLEISESKNKLAEDIHNILNDDRIKAYMLFLKYSLNFFNNFNALFQSRKILIHKLTKSSEQLIKQIGQNFLLPARLQNISSDTIHSRNFLPLNELYVGPECEKFLQNQTMQFAQEIKLKCLDFYVSATEDMIKLLPFNDIVLHDLKFLDSKLALSCEGRNVIKDLTNIATYLGTFDVTTLAFEWRVLPTKFSDADKNILATLDIDDMWKKIFETKNFNDQPMFPNLEKLIQAVLSLPHSNAESNRIFSIVRNVKNRKRNRISISNLNGICKFKSSFQTKNVDHSFHVDARHLELHNSQNLYSVDSNDNLDEDLLI